MYAFDYQRAKSLEHAKGLLGEDVKLLAGGHSLLPTMKQRLASPSVLVDISALPELRGIEDQGESLVIGAGVPHAEVATCSFVQESIPSLAHLAGHIGDPQVRRKGTLGGSIANNDPAACYPAACLALDAVIETTAGEVKADDFFQGLFEVALEEEDVIVRVRFRKPEASAYVKFEQPASRFALAGVYVARFGDGVRLAVTGASEDGVFRHTGMEEALQRDFSPQALEGLTVEADGLIADIHGSSGYRAHLVKVLAGRAVAHAQS